MKIKTSFVVFLMSSFLSATAQPEYPGYTFTAAQALQVHAAYDPKDFYKLDENTRYVSLHLDEFLPTASIRRYGPVSTLALAPMPAIGQVWNRASGSDITLDNYVRQSQVQGIIVLHHGKIVYERYARMTSADKHIYFSLSKIMVSAIIGILEQEGRLSAADPLGKYLPQLRGSDWAAIRIVDVLNMCAGMTGLQFDDPEAQTDSSNVYFRFASHMGLARRTSATSTDIWAIFKSMRKQKEPGTAYEYSSVNTVLLTLLAEQITGMRFADLVSGYIWRHIGAEADAYIGLSSDGLASSSAMVSSTLRDLARFGLIFSPSWPTVSRAKIIPDSYFTQICRNGAPSAAFGKGVMGSNAVRDLNERPDHNAWQWDAVMTDGDFFKSGTHGQCLYISPSRDLVIACFAHDQGANIGWARAIATSGLFTSATSSSNK